MILLKQNHFDTASARTKLNHCYKFVLNHTTTTLWNQASAGYSHQEGFLQIQLLMLAQHLIILPPERKLCFSESSSEVTALFPIPQPNSFPQHWLSLWPWARHFGYTQTAEWLRRSVPAYLLTWTPLRNRSSDGSWHRLSHTAGTTCSAYDLPRVHRG